MRGAFLQRVKVHIIVQCHFANVMAPAVILVQRVDSLEQHILVVSVGEDETILLEIV